jgi:hypothetical protein
VVTVQASLNTITAGICDWRNGVQEVSLHSSSLEAPMSALGQKRTLTTTRMMSALPPKADIRNLSFVIADDEQAAAETMLAQLPRREASADPADQANHGLTLAEAIADLREAGGL